MNEPIILYGDRHQPRAVWYVSHMIDGFVRLITSTDELQGPVNLGNPDEFFMARSGERRRVKQVPHVVS